MILDELLVALGFEYDPKEMKQFKDDIDKTNKLIRGLVRAASAGAAAITGMTIASTRASDEQGKLANEIGETVENISALQFAQQRAGGSTEEMVGSLRDLSKISAEAARGVGGGIETFGMLGISVTDLKGKLKPVGQLMLEVSQRFQGLDRARQIDMADKLGLRGSLRLLQQGPAAIRELTDEAMALGVTTAEDAAIAAEFQDSLVDMWTIIKHVTRVISRSLAPMLQEGTEKFTEWWKINKQLIESKIPEWINKLTVALKVLTIAAGAFIALRLIYTLMSLITLMKGLTAATVAANVAAFLLPALIAAGITAIAALAEDAKTFFEGGESFIGEMIEKFPQWSDEIRVVASIFATLADLTSMIFDGWNKIFDLFKSATFDDIKGFFKNLPGFLGDVTGIYTIEDRLADDLARQQSVSNSPRIEKVEITVPGSADPEATANAVFNIFQQTSQDLNSAVDQ